MSPIGCRSRQESWRVRMNSGLQRPYRQERTLVTPEMQRALLEVSTFYAADPAAVFRRVLEIVSRHYGGTTAMINVFHGDLIRFRDVVNPPPFFLTRSSIAFADSY